MIQLSLLECKFHYNYDPLEIISATLNQFDRLMTGLSDLGIYLKGWHFENCFGMENYDLRIGISQHFLKGLK